MERWRIKCQSSFVNISRNTYTKLKLGITFYFEQRSCFFQYISYLVMPFRIRMLQVHQILKTRSFDFDKIALRKIVNLFEFASLINFFIHAITY